MVGVFILFYDIVRRLTFLRFENTYPGVRCDIPAHVYQSGFAPNTQWTEEFAQGKEIREYWQGVARKYDVYKYLRPRQKVEKAEWAPEEAKWKVTLRDLGDNERVSWRRDTTYVVDVYSSKLT